MAGNQPEAERFLKDHDMIQRMSTVQAQVLGCVSCRWNVAEIADGRATTYGYEIRRCSGVTSGALSQILNRLEEADLLTAEYEPPSAYENKGRPPRRYFLPADNEMGDAFRQTLTIPEVCNLPNSASEKLRSTLISGRSLV